MEKTAFFEKNIHALSQKDSGLCLRLRAIQAKSGRYRFFESRTGETVPALISAGGEARPLHSTVDPWREARRLIQSLGGEGFLVFLGLGGGFVPLAALEKGGVRQLVLVDYGLEGIAELLHERDYTALFGDPRFTLLIDPPSSALKECIVRRYRPVVDGGIRVLPLLPRVEGEGAFGGAAEEVREAVDLVSRDYSVQAWFGKRWFSNILRNLPALEQSSFLPPPVRRAAVTAAGPSLESGMNELRSLRSGLFLIASDTSLPALLEAGIEPDGVLSIDCQQISYQHFFRALPAKTTLFLDLASPPAVASRSERRVFLAGGHPLSRYVQAEWKALPSLDTSGANVAYAAWSLAESLGAQEILLFGADFSYPEGKTYARGTYVYSHFEKQQNRFKPVEAQHSAFLFRDPALQKQNGGNGLSFWRYTTASLRFYKTVLEQKKAAPKPSPLKLPLAEVERGLSGPGNFSPGHGRAESHKSLKGGFREFLESYRARLKALSSFDEAVEEKRNVLSTILPTAAVFRRLHPHAGAGELFEETRSWCLAEIEKVLAGQDRFA